jgi:L-ascorbate metabolism protein UlaG (beta-lactamase superfamily)
MNKTVKLAFASDVIIDKNGVSMKWGRTRGYTIETPEGKVYHGGKTVFCYEEELFEDFVEGLLVAL